MIHDAEKRSKNFSQNFATKIKEVYSKINHYNQKLKDEMKK